MEAIIFGKIGYHAASLSTTDVTIVHKVPHRPDCNLSWGDLPVLSGYHCCRAVTQLSKLFRQTFYFASLHHYLPSPQIPLCCVCRNGIGNNLLDLHTRPHFLSMYAIRLSMEQEYQRWYLRGRRSSLH